VLAGPQSRKSEKPAAGIARVLRAEMQIVSREKLKHLFQSFLLLVRKWFSPRVRSSPLNRPCDTALRGVRPIQADAKYRALSEPQPIAQASRPFLQLLRAFCARKSRYGKDSGRLRDEFVRKSDVNGNCTSNACIVAVRRFRPHGRRTGSDSLTPDAPVTRPQSENNQ